MRTATECRLVLDTNTLISRMLLPPGVAGRAMDKALSSWVRQYDHGTEELLGADVEGNPSHKKAKERIEASLAAMEGKTAQTPVFGGESESHAERLKAAVAAIMERIKEFFHAVGQRFSGAEADHATP